MSYLGSWKINDWLTFPAVTHRFDTGAATDADSVPTYRIYEDETATPIATGSMALLDSSNTAGFYAEQLQLTSGTGFEQGKAYTIYVQATVNSVTGVAQHTFQILAAVDTASVSASAITAALGSIQGQTDKLTYDGSNQLAAFLNSASEFPQGAADKVWLTTTRTLTGNVSNLKKNQAVTAFPVLMRDSTNHTPATGKTITVVRSIDGAAFATGSLGTPSEVSRGIYIFNIGAADLNGNCVILCATASGCDDTLERIITVP